MRVRPAELDINAFMKAGLDRGPEDVTFILEDGEITLPPQLAILNLIFWEPLTHFCIPIRLSDVNRVEIMNTEVPAKIHTKIYMKLLKEGIFRDDARQEIWININKLNSFVEKYLPKYCGSISAYSLARTIIQPAVQEILDIPIAADEMTRTAEIKIKSRNKEFNKLIANRGALPYNVLLNYAEAGVLKSNSMQQNFVMYGCRSDIDITMQQHIIKHSAFGGLRSVEDFATEALSAKMSSYFNSVVIRETQDFARLLKLACLKIGKVYPGDCGAHRTMKFMIPTEYRDFFIHCNIVVDGVRTELTEENIDLYLNKEVDLVSPLLCNHTDGTCEWCAGRADGDVLNYLPPNTHIGLYAAALLAALISQNVLSNKHLVTTDSKEYHLIGIAKEFFLKEGNGLLLSKAVHDRRQKAVLKFPLESLGPISDLFHEDAPAPEAFSQIATMEVQYHEDADSIELEMQSDGFTPYLSEEFIAFMRAHTKSLITDEANLIVPLRGWDFSQPIMNYVVLNYNMIKFSKAVSGFFSSNIKHYTSIRRAMEDFCKIFYYKGKLNFFYIQVLMKNFLITSDTDYNTPVIADPDHVRFETMHAVSSRHAITTKMSEVKVHELISSPEACVIDKPKGYFDIFYGIS